MSDAAPQAALLETMKKAADVLHRAGIPFALAGGCAAYARGGAPSVHDVDFAIREKDADAAAQAFAAGGMTAQRPPEGWLLKAFDGEHMVDLIYRLGGEPVTGELLGRAEELEVAACRMPVLSATDLVLSWLRSLSEHYADFTVPLSFVRPMREQVDWDLVRQETAGLPFARAFLVLLEGLGVIGAAGTAGGPASPDYLAGRIERALAEDPRTHELGICVTVEQGVVYLRGEAAGERRCQLIEDVARQAAPGLLIRNEVSVIEVQPPRTQEAGA